MGGEVRVPPTAGATPMARVAEPGVVAPAARPSRVSRSPRAASSTRGLPSQPAERGDTNRVQGFDEFYLGTRADLLRQLTAMTADPELAKDVLQEAYARAWQRWGRVESMDQPTAWVRTVAWRLAVSHHRRVVVADRALRLLRVRPDQLGAAAESAVDIASALRSLSPTQRRTLVLHDMCGYTMEQVAAETGVPVGTVKSRLSRGRAAVAKQLGPAYRTGDATDVERQDEQWQT